LKIIKIFSILGRIKVTVLAETNKKMLAVDKLIGIFFTLELSYYGPFIQQNRETIESPKLV